MTRVTRAGSEDQRNSTGLPLFEAFPATYGYPGKLGIGSPIPGMSGGEKVGIGGGENGGVRPGFFVDRPVPDPPCPEPGLPVPLPLPP
jgi:hypothetical protein